MGRAIGGAAAEGGVARGCITSRGDWREPIVEDDGDRQALSGGPEEAGVRSCIFHPNIAQ